MTNLTIEEILKATGGRLISGDRKAFNRISIDSRSTETGELFVALKGEKFDGHDFVHDALQRAHGAIVSSVPVPAIAQRTIILVSDTLKALQAIAAFRRRQRSVPVVAVTGTNGKTTTKEMIATILSQSHKVLKTSGNFNNHIGLPLCVANMDGDEAFMVLEMGSNAPGDIRDLCEITKPDIAIVTNVGYAHLEGFGNIDAVRDTDLEVMGYVNTLFLNADDSFLVGGAEGYHGKRVTYGIKNDADYTADNIRTEGTLSMFILHARNRGDLRVRLPLAGHFNVLNAVGAAAVASELGVSGEDIILGLESFSGVPMRLEILEYSGATIINDVYNANPASMKGALEELSRFSRGRSMAVLGDMLELGAYAGSAHAEVVEQLNEMGVAVLIAVGPEMEKASVRFRGQTFIAANSDDARLCLLDNLRSGDAVLIKGSRGMHMENVMRKEGKKLTSEVADAL